MHSPAFFKEGPEKRREEAEPDLLGIRSPSSRNEPFKLKILVPLAESQEQNLSVFKRKFLDPTVVKKSYTKTCRQLLLWVRNHVCKSKMTMTNLSSK